MLRVNFFLILGFKRFKLRVVESHPRIAKAELIDDNSKIRIQAYSKGESNIIVFHPKTRKIYDVIKVSVYSTLNLPNKIMLNIGATVSLLNKDENRKSYLIQDSEWIVDNPSILKIDPREGTVIALREGTTKVHLVSKDQRKVKLSTTVQVSRVKKASIDFHKLPKYLTDIKSSPQYEEEYR